MLTKCLPAHGLGLGASTPWPIGDSLTRHAGTRRRLWRMPVR